MTTLNNKYLSFIKDEPLTQWQIGLIVFFLLCLFVVQGQLRKGKINFNKAEAERELVKNTPLNEEFVVSSKSNSSQVVAVKPLILEGITTIDGATVALISGDIYKVGDKLGNYTLKEITPEGVVTFEDPNTHALKSLFFKLQE